MCIISKEFVTKPYSNKDLVTVGPAGTTLDAHKPRCFCVPSGAGGVQISPAAAEVCENVPGQGDEMCLAGPISQTSMDFTSFTYFTTSTFLNLTNPA